MAALQRVCTSRPHTDLPSTPLAPISTHPPTHHPSAASDEDEGFKAALNIDTSVAQLGFYGAAGERLWARSGVESLHLWEWAAACNDDPEGASWGGFWEWRARFFLGCSRIARREAQTD